MDKRTLPHGCDGMGSRSITRSAAVTRGARSNLPLALFLSPPPPVSLSLSLSPLPRVTACTLRVPQACMPTISALRPLHGPGGYR